jgi:hypothetical protein
MSTIQGQLTVRDFARELESMALRFPDVTEREVTQIFWLGMHQYLRIHLIEKGLNPERSSLKQLITKAQRKEEAVEAKKQEERVYRDKANPQGHRWGRFSNAGTDSNRTVRFENENEKEPMSSGQPTNNRAGHKKPELTERRPPRDHKSNSRPGDRERRPTQSRLSKEETDRLRAEQRCFSCKEVGHEIRNCPNHQNAKAPTLSTGSINIVSLEAKGNRAREVNMSVGAI